MTDVIADGTGRGFKLGITKQNQAKMVAETHSLQNHISRHDGQVYQTISVDTGITNQTQTIMHIINNSSDLVCMIGIVSVQAITDTSSKPVVGELFEFGVDRTVSSGGSTTTPVNTNKTSGNVADVTVTGIDPVMTGTFAAIDRIYNEASGREYVINEEAIIILGKNDTFEVRFVSGGAGEAKCKVTFMMVDLKQ